MLLTINLYYYQHYYDRKERWELYKKCNSFKNFEEEIIKLYSLLAYKDLQFSDLFEQKLKINKIEIQCIKE